MLSVYHHTHWDREWYWTFRQYQLRLTQILPEIIDRLSAGALPCFTLDGQTAALEDALELLPGEASRLKGLIDSERLTVGPWFVMPDEWLVSGESLIRNLQRGIQSAKTWGCESFTGYLPDTFGHSGDIPTLLNGFGIDSAIVWRGVNPANSEFWWTSPSGAKVLTLHLTDGYFQNFFHDPGLSLENQQKAVRGWIERGLSKSALGQYLLPVGGDHLGPLTEDALNALNATLEEGWGKAVVVTTPGRFMVDLLSLTNEAIEPLVQINGELLDCSGAFLLPGVWSARLWLKQQNRRAEHGLLHVLEPLMAITQHQTGHMILSEQLALETAWKTLLLNHPHDSICGCSIDEVHRENEVRFDTVFSLSNHLIQQQKARLQRLTKPTQNDGGDCLWAAQIIHTGEQPYTGVIPFTALSQLTDSTQAESTTDKEADLSKLPQVALSEKVLLNRYETNPQEVPQSHLTVTKTQGWIWVNDIPPHSAITRPLSDILNPLPNEVTPATVQEVVEDGQSRWTLKNGLLAVEVALDSEFRVHLQQPNGDKTHYDMGHRIIDWQEQGDSYNSAPVAGDTGEAFRLILIQPGLEGPLIASLILTYESTSSTQPQMQVQTSVRLKARECRLEFETQFINTRANHKLQVAFNTGAPVTLLWAESHLSVVQRQYDPHYHEVHHLPAAPFKELKTNTGPIQRFVMTQQQLWLTEGLAEYEVRGNDLCFTLHRGFDMLSKGDTGVRGAQAGPPLNTPEGQGLQKNLAYRYGWAPLSLVSSHKDSLANESGWIPVAYHHAQQFYGCISAEHGFNLKMNLEIEETPPLITWDNPAVVRLALKPLLSTFNLSSAPASATKPLPSEGFILRVLNPTNRTQAVCFSPNGSIQAVYQSDLNECNQQCLTLTATGALEPLDMLPGQVLTLTFYAG